MEFNKFRETDKIIFVLFIRGAMGHQFSRMLAKSPNIYWYSSDLNGLTPDDTWEDKFDEKSVKQHRPEYITSKYHFNRTTSMGELPPLFSKLDYYWNPGFDYYDKIFTPKFISAGGLDIKQKLLYPSHDYPYQIRKLFPNALIISIEITDDDIDEIVDNYMSKVSNMKAFFRFKEYAPEYDTPYVTQLKILHKIKPDFNFYEKWLWYSYGSLEIDHRDEYIDHVRFYIRHNMIKFKSDNTPRIVVPYDNCLNFSLPE